MLIQIIMLDNVQMYNRTDKESIEIVQLSDTIAMQINVTGVSCRCKRSEQENTLDDVGYEVVC